MKLIIVRGLPGSGKSSFVRKNYECLHVEADMFFVKNGEYKFDRERLHFAHRKCLQTTEYMLKAGCDVVVANTFTTMKELKPYLKLANNYGADEKFIV